MSCDILDFPQCMLDILIEFILDSVNAPIHVFIDAIQFLLTHRPDIQVFAPLWSVFVYVISIFYGLFLIGAGFNFIISGYSAERRENAKQWLQNVILMVLSVQASYLIYSLISDLASRLTAGVFSMIDQQFFYINFDSTSNVALQILFGGTYLTALLVTTIFLAMNYFIGTIGVLWFPFGLFMYFIPPLRDIGKFIINKVLFVLFIPFFASMILLAASMMVNVGYFSYVRIFLVIGALTLINISMILLALLAVLRSVMSLMRTDVARGILMMKGYFMAGAALGGKDESQKSEKEQAWQQRRRDYFRRDG